MSEEDYLESARRVLGGGESDPVPNNVISLHVAALALFDIAKTLREIKAMAEREMEDEQ